MSGARREALTAPAAARALLDSLALAGVVVRSSLDVPDLRGAVLRTRLEVLGRRGDAHVVVLAGDPSYRRGATLVGASRDDYLAVRFDGYLPSPTVGDLEDYVAELLVRLDLPSLDAASNRDVEELDAIVTEVLRLPSLSDLFDGRDLTRAGRGALAAAGLDLLEVSRFEMVLTLAENLIADSATERRLLSYLAAGTPLEWAVRHAYAPATAS